MRSFRGVGLGGATGGIVFYYIACYPMDALI